MAATDFRITVETLDQGVARVQLGGDVDARAAPEMRRRLGQLTQDGESKLLIDLSEALFIDSTALGVLLATVRDLREKRGRLAVFCPDPSMQELFELVGHNLIFPVEDTFEGALRHLGARRRFQRRRTGRSTTAVTDWKRRS
jgi:anti-sigma B factor antagonist